MRSIKLFLTFFVLVTLVSCTVTENIYINDNGSGNFSVEMDGSALMAMMPTDSLKTEKSIDSTFSFKQLLVEKKDSIAKLPIEQQALLKKLENFNMRMKMDAQEKQFVFSMNTNFKNVAELQDVMETMNAFNTIQKNNKSTAEANPYLPSGGFGSNNSVLSYAYNGKKFTRKATMNTAETNEMENDSLQQYKMIFESSIYVLKYHFPKPVKKVSNTTALFSEDRKTITIQYPFSEYMANPDKLNIEVEF
ncbi:hypothetical protein D3C85_398270 [compost metagenome]